MFAAIASFAVAKLGRLGGKLAEFIIALVLMIVLVGGPYWLGMRHQRQADAAVLAQAQVAAAHRLALAQAHGETIAARLEQAKSHVKTVYRTITKEVPHVVIQYRPAPGAALQPIPAAVFTRGFVRLWNHALDPELPAAAAGAAGSASKADPFANSGVSEQQLLANHVSNAQSCDAIRRQLTALITWHKTVGAP